MKITKRMIKRATAHRKMDATYKFLCDICKTYPDHKDEGGIIAKTIIIGRVYAASLERRKNKSESNDSFYEDVVSKFIKKSHIDKHIAKLNKITTINSDSIPVILEAHDYLNSCFRSLVDINKVSLASKYLHSHFPHLFFISDGRAKVALSQQYLNIQHRSPYFAQLEQKDYKNFFYRCLELQSRIKRDHGIQLSPRQIDNLLLDVYEGRY